MTNNTPFDGLTLAELSANQAINLLKLLAIERAMTATVDLSTRWDKMLSYMKVYGSVEPVPENISFSVRRLHSLFGESLKWLTPEAVLAGNCFAFKQHECVVMLYLFARYVSNNPHVPILTAENINLHLGVPTPEALTEVWNSHLNKDGSNRLDSIEFWRETFPQLMAS